MLEVEVVANTHRLPCGVVSLAAAALAHSSRSVFATKQQPAVVATALQPLHPRHDPLQRVPGSPQRPGHEPRCAAAVMINRQRERMHARDSQQLSDTVYSRMKTDIRLEMLDLTCPQRGNETSHC